MARRKKEEEKEEETVGTEPLILEVTAEHILSPHSVILLKDEDTVEVTVMDHANGIPIGAKTVEQILRETGVALPYDDDTVSVSFSPHTYEVIAAVKQYR